MKKKGIIALALTAALALGALTGCGSSAAKATTGSTDAVAETTKASETAGSEAAGEAFNIGAGGREYLIDVYHQLCDALGKQVEPNFGPDRAGDIRDSNADISKARELLHYDPEYDFAKGIHLAINWYKENL